MFFTLSDIKKLFQSVKAYIDAHTDLSNLITRDEYSSLYSICVNHVAKGSLATVNGQSVEDGGNIELDLSLYRIVSELPEVGLNNKVYLVPNTVSTDGRNTFDEYLYNDTTEPPTWELMGQFKSDIDLSGYLKIEDAEKKYMAKGSQDNTNQNAPSLSISQSGAFNNYGNNGQAFNAVRDVSSTNKYQTEIGSAYPLNAASFGVKDTGTTAFSHKKYTTFNKADGTYTGARNTAVLVFSGNSGLLYAKNTGSANDVTDAMYKYVGVIDSPDAKQRVYSASQVDALLSPLVSQIEELKKQLAALQQ